MHCMPPATLVSNMLLFHGRLCCIFLAGKIEDSFVNISEMMRIYNRFPESRILECEIVLLEVIYMRIYDVWSILTTHWVAYVSVC